MAALTTARHVAAAMVIASIAAFARDLWELLFSTNTPDYVLKREPPSQQ